MMIEKNIVHLTLTERIDMLVADIVSADEGSIIRIVAGEADCAVYGNSKVVDALEEAKKRHVNVKMITGPVILVDEEERKNRILDLHQRGILDLFYRPNRHQILHYRTIETQKSNKAYVEAPHEPLQDSKVHKVIKLEHPDFWAKKLTEDFDNLITSGKVKRVMDPEKDVALLSPTEVAGLLYSLNKAGKDYDFLSKEEILTYLNAG